MRDKQGITVFVVRGVDVICSATRVSLQLAFWVDLLCELCVYNQLLRLQGKTF